MYRVIQRDIIISISIIIISTEYRLVTEKWTDGRTDRQTDILRQHSPRYAWHRAVKITMCA